MKPIIAVTLRDGDQKGEAVFSSAEDYHKALTFEGADTLFIGPDHDGAFYDGLADFCDGLVLTGGRDIDPSHYHQSSHKETIPTAPGIDRMDFELIHAFCRRKKPILGICRGAQDINVYFGGTLFQHLPDTKAFYCNHKEKQIPGSGAHHVTWTEDTLGLYKKDQVLPVNSLHHQGIDRVAPGFRVMAVSEDSLVESICRDKILAVQWHPERLTKESVHRDIFRWFVSLCLETAAFDPF